MSILDKFDNLNLTPVSGTDAAFLISESPNSPMHIGSGTIVEGSLSFDDFKAILKASIHKMPKFRKRLISVPFNVDFPYWIDDPNFDIDIHIQRIALPKPHNWSTLRELASSIFSTPLDMRRPPWSIHFIEGLDNASPVPKGSVAILTKIHHVMIDGMSGMDLMKLFFQPTPDKIKIEKNIPEYRPEPIPDDLSLLMKSYVNFLKEPLKLPKAASLLLAKNLKSKATKWMMPKNDLPNSSYSVPRTIFNGNISPRRTWGTAILELDRVKALKKAMDVTLNDVVLAICAGALRKYLLEKDKLPTLPLVANVPISVRSKSENNEMNNKISNLVVPIATHIEDPIERLEVIHEHTYRGKQKHKTMGAKTLSKMADAVPFGLVNLAAGIYSRYNLSKLHKPIFNVTISNVPGPQQPIYINGHKVFTTLAMGPLIDGLGLIIIILSYNGTLTISSTSDAKTMPDVDVFSRYIRESANELEAIILKEKGQKTN